MSESFESDYQRYKAAVDRDLAEQYAIIDAKVKARVERRRQQEPHRRLFRWIKSKWSQL